MAICSHCDQEMTRGVGCTQDTYDDMEGGPYPRIPFEDDEGRNCPDCYAPPGTFHHPGCDGEICPRCQDQAISCSCTDDEDDDV